MAMPPGRPWAELQHDLLVAIMTRVGAPDLLSGGAPRACSSWRTRSRGAGSTSATGPHSPPAAAPRDRGPPALGSPSTPLSPASWTSPPRWRKGGSRPCCSPNSQMRITSCSSLRAFSENTFQSYKYLTHNCEVFQLITFHQNMCPNLQYFSLPSTCMTYDQFCKAIGELHSLKGMAVDESLINYDVLLHVHQCCPDFVELKVSALYVDEEMASVICTSLPQLKKLEIPSSDMPASAIIMFLDCLEELEYLNISGYETSTISSVVLEKASRLKVFLWNSKFELGEFVDCSNCGEHNINPGEPCKCMMDHKVMDWLAGPA